ncbi:MAG: hypothetical protein ABI142_04290, partial [Bryocella sp.]
MSATTSSPIRGTQSFVGVMIDTWKRPSLTVIEIVWRAIAFIPVWIVGQRALGAPLSTLIPNTSEVAPPSPEQALRALHNFFSTIRALTNPHTLLTFAGLALFWVLIATIGRAII